MGVLKLLLVVFVLLVIAAIGVGFTLPDRAKVERSVLIDASPATVYTVLNGFHQFNRWSPWADIDPQTVYTYQGPLLGVGARSAWSSKDPKAGSGDQEILEATPYTIIKVRLRFEGMDMDNLLTYTLTAAGAGTQLSWTYLSDFNGNLLNRYFGLLLDRMIGPDFDKGLSRLKSFAESLPRDDFTAIQPELIQTEPKPIAYLSAEAAFDSAAPVIAAAYARIGGFLAASGRHMVDAPMTVTRDFDAQTRNWKFDAVIPIDQECTAPAEGDDIQCSNSYAGWAIRARHVGPYTSMDRSYAKLAVFRTVAGLTDNGAHWEQYVTDPGTTAPDSLLTLLYAPVK
ncbi:MAG: Polyketide cyclase / dehydrase and lipid transport [Hydrocarboniphaga sp.]|uniref:SRPBCC family protein n=1 Tax=Hydrocarboniphaga sp. TaxID=2033016 RepID=UPI0026120CE2|nr:SRPBCC family protein [Hydrocarboniphaga sp.]MDB5971187.1 Polyketide cyclase / dehydrase and lipid transport [Hydrocarboniphaga sp.]